MEAELKNLNLNAKTCSNEAPAQILETLNTIWCETNPMFELRIKFQTRLKLFKFGLIALKFSLIFLRLMNTNILI